MIKILPLRLFPVRNMGIQRQQNQAYGKLANDTVIDTFEYSNEPKNSELNICYGDSGISAKEHYNRHVIRVNSLGDDEKIIGLNSENLTPQDFTTDNFIYSDRGYTDGMADNIALLIYNDKRGMLTQLSPKYYNDEEKNQQLQNFIYSAIGMLDEISDVKPIAWLVGGIEEESEDLRKTICTPLIKKI